MDTARLTRLTESAWRIEPHDDMRVPVVLYGDEDLIAAMDDKVHEQAANVARLPGIVGAVYAMPDAHWGYGFPIGGVAAFDAAEGGVVSAGGVGFDISCGVRTLTTGLRRDDVESVRHRPVRPGAGRGGQHRHAASRRFRDERHARGRRRVGS
jgi:tRNA-splicing ligase RtcB